MDGKHISSLIKDADRKTPVLALIKAKQTPCMRGVRVFGEGRLTVALGEWKPLRDALIANAEIIEDCELFCDRAGSALSAPFLPNYAARIEPGARVREHAMIERGAILMHGAVVNIGAHIHSNALIDMNAVIGAGAIVEAGAHVGAGAVIAGVLEPIGARPVVIGQGALIGANAVILEGVRVGRRAVVGAGSVVNTDIPDEAVCVGMPARIVKRRDETTDEKTRMNPDLRTPFDDA